VVSIGQHVRFWL